MSGRVVPNRYGEAPRAQLSLLDRLIDDAPDRPADPPVSSAAALVLLRRSVQRDLEALLNARRRWRSWPARLTELRVSSLGYGISDFAAGTFNDPQQRDVLRAEVEAAIRCFEPRLASVRVLIVQNRDAVESVLRLRIEAVMHADPAPEPVAFDTLVDAATAEVSVQASSVREPAGV